MDAFGMDMKGVLVHSSLKRMLNFGAKKLKTIKKGIEKI